MPVRPTMAPLIAEVRLLIGDPAGAASEQFTDEQIQDALDATAENLVLAEMPAVDQHPGDYTFYQARYGGWFEEATLYDYNLDPLASTTADLRFGIWTFDPGLADPTIFVTGTRFNVQAAAATLIGYWIARLKNEYDVTVGGDRFERSQKIQNLLALQNGLAAGSTAGRIVTVPNVRSDMRTSRGGW